MAGTILNAGKQHFATARYGRVADRTSKREISAAKRAAG
jgi:hypothetical protein